MPETQDCETDKSHGYSFHFFPNKAQKNYKKNIVIFSVYKHCQIELIIWTMQSIIPARSLIKTVGSQGQHFTKKIEEFNSGGCSSVKILFIYSS